MLYTPLRLKIILTAITAPSPFPPPPALPPPPLFSPATIRISTTLQSGTVSQPFFLPALVRHTAWLPLLFASSRGLSTGMLFFLEA
jgi:hypothetical protein